MSRILITGIAGFLGSHLADKFIADGHEVIGIDNLVGGYESNVPKGIKFYRFGTEDVRSCSELIEFFKPDVIYHAACTAYEGLSVFSPSFIVQNTLQNTLGILSAAIQHKVKRFVYCSSMARYGHQEPPFTENMEPKPNDPYGVAKVAGEKIIELLAETHGFEWVVAIPHNIIGTRQKYDDPYRNVASIMINRMLQGKSPIIYGDGEQRRSFSYVGDCVEVLAKMIDCPSGSFYNIGPDDKDGTVLTINELYQKIAWLLDFKGEPTYMADRPREVKNAWCSSEEIRNQFGFKMTKTIDLVLDEMIQDIKTRGVKPFSYEHVPLEIKSGAPNTWTERLF